MVMDGRWGLNRVKLRMATLMVMLLVFHQNLCCCWSLNTEGMMLLRYTQEEKETRESRVKVVYDCKRK